MHIRDKIPTIGSPIERRLAADYGAIFITTATAAPKIIFKDDAEVRAFQALLDVRRFTLGSYEIELQAVAVEGLIAATNVAAEGGKEIGARAADSGARAYGDTLALWNRNVSRGLDHWITEGKLTAERARSVRDLAGTEQVRAVLEMEDSEDIYFSTYFDKSILYSVAAPGASQHLSLLAVDISEYQDERIEAILAGHGWYRTVTSDLPHFTYLGHPESDLPGLGLRLSTLRYDSHTYRFWTADLDAAGI
jgi:hypothetical protein